MSFSDSFGAMLVVYDNNVQTFKYYLAQCTVKPYTLLN